MNEYIIVNKTAIEKRLEELRFLSKVGEDTNPDLTIACQYRLSEIELMLSQSTSLIPELQKTWNAAYTDALSIDEETYKPLFFKDYISNLKLDI